MLAANFYNFSIHMQRYALQQRMHVGSLFCGVTVCRNCVVQLIEPLICNLVCISSRDSLWFS